MRWEKQQIKGLGNITYINVDHFSPRVGVTWDFLNNGRTKAYASYSQFVPLIPMDMNVRSLERRARRLHAQLLPTDLACDTDGDFAGDDCIDPRHGASTTSIRTSSRRTRRRSWPASSCRSEPAGSSGVKGIYRALGRVLEDTCVPVDVCDNYAFFNPGSSVAAPPEFAPGKRYFRGIEVTAQKSLSDNWIALRELPVRTLEGNFDGYFRAIGGFFARNPNITDDFDYPAFQVNAYGNLTLDRRNQAKLQAAYVFPFGLTMSASGYYQTGTPLSRIGWWDAYAGPELFITPRGSDGPHSRHLRDGPAGGLRPPARPGDGPHPREPLQRAQPAAGHAGGPGLVPHQANNDLPDADQRRATARATQWQQPRTLRLGLRVSF